MSKPKRFRVKPRHFWTPVGSDQFAENDISPEAAARICNRAIDKALEQCEYELGQKLAAKDVEIAKLNADLQESDDQYHVQLELTVKANAKLEKAKAALKEIQHANGSPFDEDFVTTTARETLAQIEGEREK